jgi:hypothetical protein
MLFDTYHCKWREEMKKKRKVEMMRNDERERRYWVLGMLLCIAFALPVGTLAWPMPAGSNATKPAREAAGRCKNGLWHCVSAVWNEVEDKAQKLNERILPSRVRSMQQRMLGNMSKSISESPM